MQSCNPTYECMSRNENENFSKETIGSIIDECVSNTGPLKP